VRRAVDELVCALRFLTRLPLPAQSGPARFGAAAFPVVGLLLGAAGLAVDRLAAPLPGAVRDVVVLAAWAWMTGAIHYDGLADTLDAVGVTGREERLRVMRDGTVGVFAVLSLVLIVAIELGALGELRGGARTGAILAAPVLGRWAMVATGARASSARAEGLGAAFAREVGHRELAVATLLAVFVLVSAAGAGGALACFLVGVGAAVLRRLAASAFGGVTGDVIGASGVLAEALGLVVLASR
jgi:adenosylcobinamide-GDP ribazoletransferase